MKRIPHPVNQALHFFVGVCFILIVNGYFIAKPLFYRRNLSACSDVVIVQYITFRIYIAFPSILLVHSGRKPFAIFFSFQTDASRFGLISDNLHLVGN